MTKPTLLPDPTCLHLQLLDGSSTAITAVVTTTSEEAKCALGHRYSSRIHSRCVREMADLPWMGCAVHLELHARRFFCSNLECARQIFTERLPTVVAPYARRTTRLTDGFTLMGFADRAGRPESAWWQAWVLRPAPTAFYGSSIQQQSSQRPPRACWGSMTLRFADAEPMERS
jgi:hypothetical protein